jgi:hypothetical protein
VAAYKLTQGATTIRTADGANIPADPANADYRAYLAWDAVPGNTADPADPPPLVFTEDTRIAGSVRTTDATPTEVYRLPLLPLTGYTGVVVLIGVDTGNGAVRVIRASFAVKRLGGGALAVGAPVVLASHADAGATTWQIAASVGGNDALVTVTGAAGRTIDWSLSGQMT